MGRFLGTAFFSHCSAVILAGLVALSACAGGMDISEEEATDTPVIETPTLENPVTLSGSVAAPAVVSANISSKVMSMGKAAVSDDAAACENFVVYQLTTGTEVGTGTCSSDGSFSITVEKDDLKGSASDEFGDTFTFRGVTVATVEGKDLYGYIEVSVADDTTTISSGAIDSDTSISALDMLDKLGITDLSDIKTSLTRQGADVVGRMATFDPKCFYTMQKKLTSGANTSNGGVGDSASKARDACKVYMAGGDLASTGYSNWGRFMKACVHGDLPEGVQSTVGSKIDDAGVANLSGSDWRSNYTSYTGVMDKFSDIVGTRIAGGAGLLASASISGLSENIAGESDSFCGSELGNDNYVGGMTEALLKASDVTELDKNMNSDDGMKVWLGSFEQCKSSGDWSKCNAVEMHGMLDAYDGNFDKFYRADGGLNSDAIITVNNYIGATDTSGMTEDQKRQMFRQVGSTLAGGEWTDFKDKQEVYATQWQNQFTSGGTITHTPMSAGTYDSRKTCVDACAGNRSCMYRCFEESPPPSEGDNNDVGTFTIGGLVSGLGALEEVVLRSNGGDDLTVSANGQFVFSTAVVDGTHYIVTVLTKPAGKTCAVTGGTGIISGGNVTNVSVACLPPWAKTVMVNANSSVLMATAVDASGNIYAAGYIVGSGEYDFGNGKIATTPFSGWNAVVVKYNSSGAAQWVKVLTAAAADSGFIGVSVGTSGNIYAVGYIRGNGGHNFGNGVTATGAFTGANTVIVKYNSSGDAQWAKTVTAGTSSSSFYGVSVDISGNIYAVGYISGSGGHNFGSGTIAGTYTANNVVIVKYNSSGDTQWAKTVTVGANYSFFNGVSVDPSGNAYAVGYITGTGNFNFGNGTIAGGAGTRAVLVKYNPDGDVQLAKLVIGTVSSFFKNITIDTLGNIYAAGEASGSGGYDFGNGKIATGAYSGRNAVVVKYNSSGDTQWAKTVTSGADDTGFSAISVDQFGNAYAAGYIEGTGEYGFGNSKTATATFVDDSVVDMNAVIVKYNSSGDTQWAKTVAVGANISLFNGVSADASGNAYAVGYINGTGNFNFGSGIITGNGAVNATYASERSAVIVKYLAE